MSNPGQKASLAPEHVMRAALHVLFMSGCYTRNWTLNDEITRAQINDLWEAIHEIPSLLTRWRDDAELELLMYLDEYNHKWPSPQLRAGYEQVRDGQLNS